MTDPFSKIPEVVIDYVRSVFANANDKVTRTMSAHPAMHEESLDHTLVMELSATPPAFFANERVGVALESHWLGGRHMFGRWEIADIAFFVILRFSGRLTARKVALLQTKRLYSREIPVTPVDEFDFRIGIGRLVDRTDPQLPMSVIRRFKFEGKSAHRPVPRSSRYSCVLRLLQPPDDPLRGRFSGHEWLLAWRRQRYRSPRSQREDSTCIHDGTGQGRCTHV
jgi:hypothetical protein